MNMESTNNVNCKLPGPFYPSYKEACRFGYLDVVNNYLKLGASSNNFNELDDSCPLGEAFLNKHKDIIILLLKKNCNPNSRGNNKQHVLHYYAQSSNLDEDFCEEIFNATCKNFIIKLDEKNSSNMTPLMLAVQLEHCKKIEYLLNKSANPNAVDEENQTIFHHISRYSKNVKCLKAIFKASKVDVNLDLRDIHGRTALELAVANHLLQIVTVLLEYHSNIENFVFPNKIYGSQYEEKYKDNCYIIIHITLASTDILRLLYARGVDVMKNRTDAISILQYYIKEYIIIEDDDDVREAQKYNSKLEYAKKIDVTNDLTLYDMIVTDKKIGQLVKTDELLKFMNEDRMKTLGQTEKKVCSQMIVKKMLKEVCKEIGLDDMLKTFNLPHLVNSLIENYLNYHDLLQFIKACNR